MNIHNLKREPHISTFSMYTTHKSIYFLIIIQPVVYYEAFEDYLGMIWCLIKFHVDVFLKLLVNEMVRTKFHDTIYLLNIFLQCVNLNATNPKGNRASDFE